MVLSPSADPNAVQLAFPDATSVRLAPDGQLIATTPGGELRQSVPTAYQEIDGRRRIVMARYKLLGGGTAGFALAPYDRSQPLVIDPVLVLQQSAVSTLARQALVGFTPSVFLDTADPDATAIAVDSAGCTYVAGSTDSTTGAGMDAYVAKWDATRTQRLYTAILAGSGSERAHGLAVDASGSAYVVGVTNSPNFPTAAAIQSALGVDEDNVPSADAFVAKIAPTGQTLTYSTFLGGSDDDDGMGIAIDAAGGAYVTGNTRSTNFPTAAPIQPALTLDSDGDPTRDAWVAKLAPAGSALAYSTYLGGSDEELAAGIDIDGSGAAYLIGSTVSTNFPCVSPLQPALALDVNGEPNFDLFITKVNPAGTALSYSTYLGGNGGENGAGIAVDASGCPVVVGSTIATNFPTQAPIQPALGLTAGGSPTNDAFITKLNAAGSALLFSTYLGGSSSDAAEAVELDGAGHPVITGFTHSNAFPVADPIQATAPTPGQMNGFVSSLSSDGATLEFSSYVPGTTPVHPRAVATTATGALVISGGQEVITSSVALAGDDEIDATIAARQPGPRGFVLVDSKRLLFDDTPPSTTNFADKRLGVIGLIDPDGTQMFDGASTQAWFTERCQQIRAKIGPTVPLFLSFWATNNLLVPAGAPQRGQGVLYPWADSNGWAIFLERVGWLAQAAVRPDVNAKGVLMEAEDHINGPRSGTPVVRRHWPNGPPADDTASVTPPPAPELTRQRANAYVDALRPPGSSSILWVGCYGTMDGKAVVPVSTTNFKLHPFEGAQPGFIEFWKVICAKGRCLILPEDLYTRSDVNPSLLMKKITENLIPNSDLGARENAMIVGVQMEKGFSPPPPGSPEGTKGPEVAWRNSGEIRRRLKLATNARSTRVFKGANSRSLGVWLYADSIPDWFSAHPDTSSPTDQHSLMTDALHSVLPWPQAPF